MAGTTTDRRAGVTASAAIKTPCVAATTANITLSGEQTVDGVAVVTGDRVLVKNQTDASENGIYEVDTSAWTRTKDWDGIYDVQEGTLVRVNNGTQSGWWYVATSGTITIGTTDVTISLADSSLVTISAFAQSLLDELTAKAMRETLLIAGPSAYGSIAPHKNLKVVPGTTTTTQITVTADSIWAEDPTTKDLIRVDNINLADIDITVSGAGGLDAGVEAISTWYSVFFIYNVNTAAKAGILSLSDSAPTLPAGYTHQALVTKIYNDAGGDLDQIEQNGTIVKSEAGIASPISVGLAGSATLINLSAYIPPNIVRKIHGSARLNITDAGAGYIEAGLISSGTIPSNRIRHYVNSGGVLGTDMVTSPYMIPIIESQKMYYTLATNIAGGTSGMYLYIGGWEY